MCTKTCIAAIGNKMLMTIDNDGSYHSMLNPDLIIPEGAIPCGESILCGRDAEFHHTTQMVMNPKPDELLSILNDARIIALPGWKSIVTMKCDIALCKQHNEEFVRGQQVLKEWNNADPEGS